MKKNLELFQTELKTVTAKIAELEERCRWFEKQNDLSDTDYAEYEKLGMEIETLKERQNQILMLIHASR